MTPPKVTDFTNSRAPTARKPSHDSALAAREIRARDQRQGIVAIRREDETLSGGEAAS